MASKASSRPMVTKMKNYTSYDNIKIYNWKVLLYKKIGNPDEKDGLVIRIDKIPTTKLSIGVFLIRFR